MYVLPARRLAIAPRGLSGTFSCLRWRMYSSSSSKPSSPSDRPRNLATPSSSSTKRKAGISSVGGEALAGGQGGFSKLPAVPNTDHLHPAGTFRWPSVVGLVRCWVSCIPILIMYAPAFSYRGSSILVLCSSPTSLNQALHPAGPYHHRFQLHIRPHSCHE